MGAVDPVIVLVLLVLFLPLLALDRQQVLLQRDLNVLGSIPGTSTFASRLSSVSETAMVGAHSAPAGYSSSHLPSRKWAPYLAFVPRCRSGHRWAARLPRWLYVTNAP